MNETKNPAVNPAAEDDEISLIDLLAVILRYKWMILGICAEAAIAVLAFSVVSLLLPPEKSPLPNRYTPQAVMLIQESQSGSGGLGSALSSSGPSSLAGLAGVNVQQETTNSALAVYLLQSNLLLDAVTDEFGLIERYEIEESPRASSRDLLKKKLTGMTDENSGVFTVSFTDTDPEFACRVVNYTVNWLENKFTELGIDKNKIQKENLERSIQSTYSEILKLEQESQKLGASVNTVAVPSALPSSVTVDAAKIQLELAAQRQVYTQLKTQYELLKIQMQSESPVFRIIERPEIPDRKSGPSRGMLCIIVMFAAFFLSVFLAFALNAFQNIRSDPEAWAKLHPQKKNRKRKEATEKESGN